MLVHRRRFGFGGGCVSVPVGGWRGSHFEIGEPSFIAQRLGLTVAADFRPDDMAAGGGDELFKWLGGKVRPPFCRAAQVERSQPRTGHCDVRTPALRASLAASIGIALRPVRRLARCAVFLAELLEPSRTACLFHLLHR